MQKLKINADQLHKKKRKSNMKKCSFALDLLRINPGQNIWTQIFLIFASEFGFRSGMQKVLDFSSVVMNKLQLNDMNVKLADQQSFRR